MTKFETYADVQTFVNNSGVLEWEWGGKSSLEGFTHFLWNNFAEVDADDYASELAGYIESVGENLSDYGLSMESPR